MTCSTTWAAQSCEHEVVQSFLVAEVLTVPLTGTKGQSKTPEKQAQTINPLHQTLHRFSIGLPFIWAQDTTSGNSFKLKALVFLLTTALQAYTTNTGEDCSFSLHIIGSPYLVTLSTETSKSSTGFHLRIHSDFQLCHNKLSPCKVLILSTYLHFAASVLGETMIY